MKYLIPKHTKCIVSILTPSVPPQIFGTKHVVDKENLLTEFPVIITDYNNPRRLLDNGWQWVRRIDDGVCMFNSHLFIDIDKKDLVPI